jgi:hypothetical protein
VIGLKSLSFRRRAICIVLAALVLAILTQAVARADPGDDVCGDDQGTDPTIVSVNCRFEGKGNQVDGFGLVHSNWNPFIVMGSPHFDTLDTHNGYGWLPAHQGDEKIDTQGRAWSAGVWQAVPNVIPGHGYRAEAGWVVSQNSTAEGRIGIDPTGGTNPASPNIIWSRPILLCNSMRCRHIVQAYATGTTLTVFMQVTIATPHGSDNCWMTAIAVKTDATMPTATPTNTATPSPTATNTRVPATRTPTALPATATLLATAAATSTPTQTPTETATPTETPEPTETDTPVPTATRRPTPTPTLQPVMALNAGDVNGGTVLATGLLGLSACGMVLAVAVGGGTLWYWRRRLRAG